MPKVKANKTPQKKTRDAKAERRSKPYARPAENIPEAAPEATATENPTPQTNAGKKPQAKTTKKTKAEVAIPEYKYYKGMAPVVCPEDQKNPKTRGKTSWYVSKDKKQGYVPEVTQYLDTYRQLAGADTLPEGGQDPQQYSEDPDPTSVQWPNCLHINGFGHQGSTDCADCDAEDAISTANATRVTTAAIALELAIDLAIMDPRLSDGEKKARVLRWIGQIPIVSQDQKVDAHECRRIERTWDYQNSGLKMEGYREKLQEDVQETVNPEGIEDTRKRHVYYMTELLEKGLIAEDDEEDDYEDLLAKNELRIIKYTTTLSPEVWARMGVELPEIRTAGTRYFLRKLETAILEMASNLRKQLWEEACRWKAWDLFEE